MPTTEGMPCFYPEGEPGDWCERHVQEAAATLKPGRALASS